MSDFVCLIQTFSQVTTLAAILNAQKFVKSPNFQAVHHLLYSSGIFLCFVEIMLGIFCFFENLSAPHYLMENRPLFGCHWVFFPTMISCTLNTYLTNCVLSRKLVGPILYIGFAYVLYSFVYTKLMGEPDYALMHWNNLETPAVAMGLVLLFAMFYVMLCKVNERLKERSLLLRIKNKKELTRSSRVSGFFKNRDMKKC